MNETPMNAEPVGRSGEKTSPSFGRLGIAGILLYFLIHSGVWTGLVLLVPGSDRVSFEYLGDMSTPWVRQFIVPLVGVIILQAIFLSYLGNQTGLGWGEVFTDQRRTAKQWLWLPVGGFVLMSMVGSTLISGWNEAGVRYAVGLAGTVLLVGITEEVSFRGVTLVWGRRVFSKEWQAAVFATCLFGLFHLPNTLLGNPLQAELIHVVQTAVLGMMFYAMRRLSGSLWLPIIVHAVWDYIILQSNWDIISSVKAVKGL